MSLWAKIGIGIGALLLVLVLVAWGYRSSARWTGFVGYPRRKPPKGREYVEGKTLWDWLQLLLVPAALAILVLLFNSWQDNRDRERAEDLARADHAVALDDQRERALQAFFDAMSALIIDQDLLRSDSESAPGVLARTRTLSTLRRLDDERKGSVLQFLTEAGLIYEPDFVVDLAGADLSGATLSGVVLNGTHLQDVDLSGADLSGAELGAAYIVDTDLSGADLENAYLGDGTWLSQANLQGADLRFAHMRGAHLDGADLTGADLTGACADEANFADATLGERTSFQHAYLRAATFTGVRMSGGSRQKETAAGQPAVNFRASYLAYANLDSSVADSDFSSAILLYGRGAGDAQEGISGIDLSPFRKLTMPVAVPLVSSEWAYCPGIFPFIEGQP